MAGHEPRLVLWDIDLTLVTMTGVAAEAYSAAFERVAAQPWRSDLRFNGHTELAMADSVLRFHGVEPDPALVAEFLAVVREELHARADLMVARGRVLTGAAESLAAVGALAGARQSVLTGNLPSVAALKLELFGLAGWVDFSIGAFGDDAVERSALVPHAWRRVGERYGEVYLPSQTVLIGDTVRDVEAALAHGAAIVAVASGRTTAQELADAGAAVVLPDLGDTAAVLNALDQASEFAAGTRAGDRAGTRP